MIATLQYNTDNPTDAVVFRHAVKASEIVAAICEFKEWLRDQCKYQSLSDDAREFGEATWDMLWNCFHDMPEVLE